MLLVSEIHLRKVKGKDKPQLTVDISVPNRNETEAVDKRCCVKSRSEKFLKIYWKTPVMVPFL